MSELATIPPSTPALLRPVARPSELVEAHKELVVFVNDVLEDGKDYGKIPGTGEKKNLLKPGAERLVAGFGLRPEYEVIEQDIDHSYPVTYSLAKWVTKNVKPKNWEEMKNAGTGRNRQFSGKWVWQEAEVEVGETQGLYRYVIRARLFRGDVEVGQGVGACSSMETKYVRAPRDSENTILKMAKKRAFVDSVLTTLGMSDRFTQDIEDIEDNKRAREATRTQEPEVVEAEYVEDAPAPDPRREAAVSTLRKNGLSKKEDAPKLKEFQAACKDAGFDWAAVLVDGDEAGHKTWESLMDYVKESTGDPFAESVPA